MARLAVWATCGMNPATGYGKMEIGIIRALLAAGAELLPFPDTATPTAPTLVIGSPRRIEHWPGKLRAWSYTMSESTAPSPEWVKCLNHYYERVILPAPDLCDLYRDAGVTIPTHYIPLGVDYAPIPYVEREMPKESEPFIWLTYSLGDMRKGAELAMLAFNRLFKGDPRHKLIVKCRDNPHWLNGLSDPQIEIVRGQTSEKHWQELLYRSHAFIFPSRAEGFGLPPREAVLSGLPTIATQWLGMWDVNEWGFALPVRTMTPCQFDDYSANAEGALWAEPSRAMLDQHMTEVYNYYNSALEKTRDGRDYLMDYFTYQYTAERLLDLLEAQL
jgi:glycosyltransferase involved in cell wall biosynthesis